MLYWLVMSKRSTPRRASIMLAGLLYVATVAGAPIAHAQSEVLRSAAAVESDHSDQCPTLHVDAVCSAGGLNSVVGQTSRDLPLGGTDTSSGHSHLAALRARRNEKLSAHPVRAPPFRS